VEAHEAVSGQRVVPSAGAVFGFLARRVFPSAAHPPLSLEASEEWIEAAAAELGGLAEFEAVPLPSGWTGEFVQDPGGGIGEAVDGHALILHR
jgi:hypothetical protein